MQLYNSDRFVDCNTLTKPRSQGISHSCKIKSGNEAKLNLKQGTVTHCFAVVGFPFGSSTSCDRGIASDCLLSSTSPGPSFRFPWS